jgi:hypothetical protein
MTKSTTPSLLSTQMLDLIDLMVSLQDLSEFAHLQYASVDFVITDLPGVDLTGVSWLVVEFDIVFIMIGE